VVFSVEIQSELDGHLLPWPDVSARKMFGALVYMVDGKMFAMLSEGTVAMKLPDQVRARALTLAGVSPFRPMGRSFGRWVQFLVLLEDDVPVLTPWLESAREYVASLPAPAKRRKA
jgi:TfoX/Sxy family transcriptional regulator of competence genes